MRPGTLRGNAVKHRLPGPYLFQERLIVQPPWQGKGEVLTFVVWDTPQPQGSKKGFPIKRKSGKIGVVIVSDNHEELKTWREAVKTAAREAVEAQVWKELVFPLEGPVAMCVTFTRKRTTSTPKRKRTWPITKPDLDKTKRSVGDACKAAGVYRDDAQIVESHEYKDWTLIEPRNDPDSDRLTSPGAVVRVWRVLEEHEYVAA